MAKIDDSVKKKVPELRFKGFTDDWEERKLIEVADYRNGKAHEKDISEAGDYIVVNSKFVSTNGLVKKYSDEMIAPLSKNEIAFVLSDVPNGRAIARTFLISEENKYSLNQRIAGITPHADTNSYFLHSLMNRNHYFLRFDDGVSQTNLSKKEVEKWVELYPSYGEQQKIGSFFKQLDDTIALHQHKLDLLKEQKKGYLQKMFPKNGKKVPELRFAGFADDWEERKLGEIGSFKNGMNFGKDAMGHGSPFVNLQNIFGKNIVDDTTLELAESTEKQKVEYSLIKGDVLFIRSSVKPSGVGEAALVDSNLPDTTYSGFIIRFRPKIDIDNNFKRFVFGTKYVRNQIMARATSSANTNINQDSLSLIQVGLPNLKEQEKIGSFFKQLDDTIALHQRKLDLLKEQKKGFLQKMFV